MSGLWTRVEVKIGVLLIGWWVLIGGLADFFVKTEILPFTPSYPLWERLAEIPIPEWMTRMGGFDGVHYYLIATSGYKEISGIQAFFPMYPLLVRYLSLGIFDPLLIGLVVSGLCLYGFLILWYRLLVDEGYSKKVAWWSIGVILLSPVSFFLASFYTESLFLLLLVAFWRAYQQKKLGRAGIWGAILSATRVTGIVAVIWAIGDYFWQAWRKRRLGVIKTWRRGGMLFLGAGGLVIFMVYLWREFGDMWYFFHVQDSFDWGRQTELVLLPQVLWRYGKMFYYGLTWDFKTYALVQELVMSVMALTGLIYLGWKKIKGQLKMPWLWLGFGMVSYLIPTMTGSLASMPRYLMTVLPLIILVAQVCRRYPKIGGLFLLVTSCIMVGNLWLFVQGFWVA
jgi:hypothetical protein